MGASKLDTILAIVGVKEKSIRSQTIKKKDQEDEVNLEIEAQPKTMKIGQ